MKQNMALIYEGSVKKVFWDMENPAYNYFCFTDDYSIFDWGKMPDQLAHKGKALSILGGSLFKKLSEPQSWQALQTESSLQGFQQDFLNRLFTSPLYTQLCQTGLKHHFMDWLEDDWMKVQSVEVLRPQAFTVEKQTLYRYDNTASKTSSAFLIPLEIVFRFGMPEGSSMEKRLTQDPDYAAILGLEAQPQRNVYFERPVIEFFTKLEPTDRFLSVQEAFLISGLSAESFQNLYTLTLLLSLWLFYFCQDKNIELWDGKFEFAWTPDGLMLVDSIGPDELRLKYQGIHLSKEVIRQFYRGSAWEKALKEAKTLARLQPGVDWKTLCLEQLKSSPPPLSPTQKHLVENLYGTLVNTLLDQPIIPTTMGFEETVSALKQAQLAGVC
jgi:phosphoribosylaminoimidazole-succinocarboxamide synthase